MWLWDQVKVCQLLYLAVLPSDSCEMGRPDESAVAGSLEVRCHVFKRSVECVGVDADDLDTLLDEPEHSLPPEAGLGEVVRRAHSSIGPRLKQDDIKRREFVLDAFECGLEISDPDEFTGGLVAEVKHNAGREAPLERDLIDRAGRLAFGQRAVVKRRINMCARVRDGPDLLEAQPIPFDQTKSSGRTPKNWCICCTPSPSWRT